MIVDDIGVIVQLTVVNSSGIAINISAATTKEFIFVKPTNVAVTKTASFVTDGTNGKLNYTTIAGDIDIAGAWSIRAHIITPTYNRKTEPVIFQVNP